MRSSAGSQAEPGAVLRGRDPHRRGGQLPVGEPLRVLAACRDHRVDQRVPVRWLDAGQRIGAAHGPDVVAALTHRSQQPDGAHRGVQADRVADPGMLGGVGGQHDRDPPPGGRDVPQPGQRDRGPGHPRGAFRIRNVARQAVFASLLERERHADDPAVELRYRHLGGRVERAEPGVRIGPLRPRRGEAQRLHDRDVQGGDRAGVPRLVVPARLGHRRNRAPGCEHGDDQHVGPAERLQKFRRRGPQAGTPDRHRACAAGLDRRGEGVDKARVAGQFVRPVVEHRDHRPLRLAGLAVRAG